MWKVVFLGSYTHVQESGFARLPSYMCNINMLTVPALTNALALHRSSIQAIQSNFYGKWHVQVSYYKL